ncbi:phosphonate metabolism transcriptional regulator PhnF [Muricoccus radiodurans]|uniref:phosphonate metabolism transcriptional regulator PhnF n=1 Tax=Muricoccus radiodurans TaxID=2231721 RepID=UPI003CF48F9B
MMPKQSTHLAWRNVEAALAADILAGRIAPGERLPTEPALMARFELGRHSIRRAVAELETRGLVQTRQGSGTYVRPAPVLDYRLSARTRFSQNLLGQGREPSGRVLSAREVPAPPHVAAALRLPPDEPVHATLRLGLADDVPINLSESYVPARRFPGWAEGQLAGLGVTEILAAHGVTDYVRLESVVTTRLPTEEEARRLDQSATQPVLVVRKVDADPSGVPVTFSESIWAGERVQLSVDHPRAEDEF